VAWPALLHVQILGNAINGCAASGLSTAVAFFSVSPKPSPAWDSNQVGDGGGFVAWGHAMLSCV